MMTRPAWATSTDHIGDPEEVGLFLHSAIVGEVTAYAFTGFQRDAVVEVSVRASDRQEGALPAGQPYVEVARFEPDGGHDALLLSPADARAVARLLLAAAETVEPESVTGGADTAQTDQDHAATIPHVPMQCGVLPRGVLALERHPRRRRVHRSRPP